MLSPEIADLDEVNMVVEEKRRALDFPLHQLGSGQLGLPLTIGPHRTGS